MLGIHRLPMIRRFFEGNFFCLFVLLICFLEINQFKVRRLPIDQKTREKKIANLWEHFSVSLSLEDMDAKHGTAQHGMAWQSSRSNRSLH